MLTERYDDPQRGLEVVDVYVEGRVLIAAEDVIVLGESMPEHRTILVRKHHLKYAIENLVSRDWTFDKMSNSDLFLLGDLGAATVAPDVEAAVHDIVLDCDVELGVDRASDGELHIDIKLRW